jgi:hypothetical protein
MVLPVVCSNHLRSTPTQHGRWMRQFRPKTTNSLLQSTDKQPKNLELPLTPTPAPPLRHLRSEKPPRKARDRPGLPWSKLKRRDKVGEGERSRLVCLCIHLEMHFSLTPNNHSNGYNIARSHHSGLEVTS